MLKDLKKYQRHFIFDISSGYVSGAVVYFNKNIQKPVIEFSIKKNIINSLSTDITELRKSVVVALDEVCSSIINFTQLTTAEFSIKSGSIFLSSPWIDFDNYVLVDDQMKPFKITNNYLEHILKTDFKNKDNTLIKTQIISVEANDYKTNLQNLIGQKVSKIEISLLDIFIDSYHKELFEKTIYNYFPVLKLNFSSFLPVLFNQIKRLHNLEDDFIFLDLTGSVADFGIFRENKIRNISSLPLGKNHILAKIISEGITSDLETASSFFIMYLRNELEEKIRKKIKNIIEKFGIKFKNDVENILNKFQASKVPLSVFVISSLETKILLQDLKIFRSNQKMFFIDKKIIKKLVEVDDENFDPFLALETEYLFMHILST